MSEDTKGLIALGVVWGIVIAIVIAMMVSPAPNGYLFIAFMFFMFIALVTSHEL